MSDGDKSDRGLLFEYGKPKVVKSMIGYPHKEQVIVAFTDGTELMVQSKPGTVGTLRWTEEA